MTLLVLAAGMGSRFGGLKQMEPVGPNGEFIIDYSVYDALKAGFTKIVFVIKKEMYQDFVDTIGSRLENRVEIAYVFQDVKDVPFKLDFERTKPWGTGHAILECANVIDENFAIINADDFYGRASFELASKELKKLKGNKFGLIGFKAGNTVNGDKEVKRGVCEVKGNTLTGLNESIIKRNGKVFECKSLIDNSTYMISTDNLVSMNLLLFTPYIFDLLKEDFKSFLEHIKISESDEFLIPIVLNKHLKSGDITVFLMETSSVWQGMTYREDAEIVKAHIRELTKKGEYNYELWN